MTKKSATRRKRSAPASTGPKKKQTVAAKKKHVRELVKAGLWGEIEKLYGKKILAKAKNYAETTQRVKKTPLEIAHEILVKNGYLLSASDETASGTPVPLIRTSTSEEIQQVDATIQKNTSTSSSPKTLTKEQLKLIETRRQEALARRRRTQEATRAPVYSPVVIRPDPADRGLQSVGVPIQEQHLSPPQASRRTSSDPAGQLNSITHRVVTPEKLPTTNQVVETEHARPQCFWDDLEAAAEIVQWENEQMAEEALEQLPATTATNFDRGVGTVQHDARQPTAVEICNTRPSAVVSLSQELLAAADIIQWEKEHEVSPEVPAFNRQGDSSGSDHEPEAPQFQLLPVHITDDCEQQNEKLPESVRPHGNIISHHEPQRSNSQSKSNAHRKRPIAALPSSASAISSKATKSSEDHQRNPTSSCSSLNQRDPTTEFIDKHLLGDKLEFPVLEFLDMMLA